MRREVEELQGGCWRTERGEWMEIEGGRDGGEEGKGRGGAV